VGRRSLLLMFEGCDGASLEGIEGVFKSVHLLAFRAGIRFWEFMWNIEMGD